jgi:hypothetical protein
VTRHGAGGEDAFQPRITRSTRIFAGPAAKAPKGGCLVQFLRRRCTIWVRVVLSVARDLIREIRVIRGLAISIRVIRG